MSDEVRRAVVERVKSPLNINLSILYPDAAIHFLKCPSHSVIRLEPTRPDGRPGAGPLPEREATNVRDPGPPLRWVEPVVWRVVRPERQGPSRTSAGVNRPLSTRRSSARAARASTQVSPTATGGERRVHRSEIQGFDPRSTRGPSRARGERRIV